MDKHVSEKGFAQAMLDALPHPVLEIAPSGKIAGVNQAAEHFFQASEGILARMTLSEIVPFGSPLIELVDQVRSMISPVTEYKVDIGSPRTGGARPVDIYASPVVERPRHVAVMLLTRSVTDKIDRQLTHRGAARTVSGLASMLAHEIRNPLSGIRGAAQLLETAAGEEDRILTQLIRDETDRIVGLVDRMEEFSDERPVKREPVNIHIVLGRVKALAKSGFARNIRIVETYDPSLPAVHGNRDQLIQVFINLVKNAAEALEGRADGEITFQTAFRPGIRLTVPGSANRISLPLEFSIIDNGPGVADEMHPYLFDPFVTSKGNGTGLGLALVAKIIGDHGGVIECQSEPRHTQFRILMPAHMEAAEAEDGRDGGQGA